MPRDLESLIDIERAAQRILRFSKRTQHQYFGVEEKVIAQTR